MSRTDKINDSSHGDNMHIGNSLDVYDKKALLIFLTNVDVDYKYQIELKKPITQPIVKERNFT